MKGLFHPSYPLSVPKAFGVTFSIVPDNLPVSTPTTRKKNFKWNHHVAFLKLGSQRLRGELEYNMFITSDEGGNWGGGGGRQQVTIPKMDGEDQHSVYGWLSEAPTELEKARACLPWLPTPKAERETAHAQGRFEPAALKARTSPWEFGKAPCSGSACQNPNASLVL